MTTVYCPMCGQHEGMHETCGARLRLEPPRYCSACGRRMVVQVRPDGWWARCAAHGVIDSTDAAAAT